GGALRAWDGGQRLPPGRGADRDGLEGLARARGAVSATAPPGARARAAGPLSLRLRGLVKRYGVRRALDGVDLELDGAQLVGVVGPDGAGKTTLLRAVAGLLEVEAREASVLGFDLRGDVRALKRETGYVPQVFGLQRELSVWENL